jgi:hypothetical protein
VDHFESVAIMYSFPAVPAWVAGVGIVVLLVLLLMRAKINRR